MRPILELIRLEEGESGTLGVLKIQKKVCFFTLEPMDKLNEISVSSIPAQQYLCKRWNSPKYGETFIILDVPGRTNVLFHWGNWIENTEGCILLGTSILKEKRGIGNSIDAFKSFMKMLGGYNLIHLTIKEVY